MIPTTSSSSLRAAAMATHTGRPLGLKTAIVVGRSRGIAQLGVLRPRRASIGEGFNQIKHATLMDLRGEQGFDSQGRRCSRAVTKQLNQGVTHLRKTNPVHMGERHHNGSGE